MAEQKPNVSLIPTEQKKRGFASASSFKRTKRPPDKSFKWLTVLLIVLIVGTVGLFFWNQSLAGEQKALEVELMNIRSEKDAALEGEIAELDKLLQSFKTALANHHVWSKLFDMIETTTIQGITFTSFEGDYGTATLTVRGLAPSYGLLAQQVKSFESEDNVMRVDVPNVKVNKVGLVDFSLTIIVKKAALQ